MTPLPRGSGITIYFLDVGAAEAIVLVAATGETMLIDGGEFGSLLRERMESLGIRRLDAVMPSHWHQNHTRAQLWALDNFAVRNFYWNGQTGDDPVFQQVLTKAKEKTRVTQLQRGDSFTFGNLSFKVMHPGPITGDANTDALALVVTCGTLNIWLAGDTTQASEESMLAAGLPRHIQVLKVGHHAGPDATTQAFLDAIRPEVAFYSWVKDSPSIPDPDVISRLTKAGAKVYGTDISDKDDTVALTSDCKTGYKVAR